MKATILAIGAGTAFLAASAHGGPIIGLVDFDGTETGLTGYTNGIYTYGGPGFGTDAVNVSSDNFGTSTWSGGDSFWPMIRSEIGPNALGMPFNISDDSVSPAAGNSVFAGDTIGFAGTTQDTNGFFGVTDTENSNNSGPISADFVFDVTGAPSLRVSIDMAAMGDFELADFFDFTYDIDGGGFQPLFTSSVDEADTQTYSMDNVANNPVVLNDPVLVNGFKLDDDYQTFSSKLSGTGSTLTIRFTAQTDGPEGFGFDNLTVATPAPGALPLLALGLLGARRRRR